MANSPHLSRNNFVKFVVGVLGSVIGAVIGLPAIGYILSPALEKRSREDWIPLGPLEKYPVGVPTLFNFTRTKVNGWERTVNSYGVYVLRKSEDPNDVIVLSNICTHLSCRVRWVEDKQEYDCPCHDAQFGPTGEILAGPPPRPLDRFETRVEDGLLSIHFREG